MQSSFMVYYQAFGVIMAMTIIMLDTQEKVLARPLSIIGTIMSFFVYDRLICFINELYLIEYLLG